MFLKHLRSKQKPGFDLLCCCFKTINRLLLWPVLESGCVFISVNFGKLLFYMCSHRKLVSSYSLLVSMLSHSSVFTSPLGRSPPFWLSFPDMVAAVTIACHGRRKVT